jgi:hypothetical protein
MAKVTVAEGTLRVKITGIGRVLGLCRAMEVPLTHVRGATLDPQLPDKRPWLGVGAAPGVAYPAARDVRGVWQCADWVFWDVHDADQAISIELEDEHYARLVLEVDHPQAVVAEIEEAISSLGAGSSTTRAA